MKITSSTIKNVEELKLLSATSTMGIGFLTAIVLSFCHLFGVECDLYNRKIEKAKAYAANKIFNKANEIHADGIMNVRFQVSGLTVFVYGVAYKNLA